MLNSEILSVVFRGSLMSMLISDPTDMVVVEKALVLFGNPPCPFYKLTYRHPPVFLSGNSLNNRVATVHTSRLPVNVLGDPSNVFFCVRFKQR
jgi:hypothetical protein